MYKKALHYRILVILSIIVFVGCAEKKLSQNKSGGGGAPEPPTPPTPSVIQDDLCVILKSYNSISSGFKTYINELCDTQITYLRNSEIMYTGGSSNPVLRTKADDRQNGNTYTKLWGSMFTPSNTKAYYDMVHLQISDPDSFKAKGFDYDANIKIYDILQKSNEWVNYRYKNIRARGSNQFSIEYYGISKFFTIKDKALYMIINYLDEDKMKTQGGTVSFLKGFIIIFDNKELKGTEVIFMTEQIAENENNHSIAVEEAVKALQEDIKRAYNNSLKIQKY